MHTHITEDGKMVAPDLQKMNEYLSKRSGKAVLITVQGVEEKRTNKQLGYWFGVLCDLIYHQRLKDAGYSWVETKAMCKRKAMGVKEIVINGKMQSFDRSLTDPDVDTIEMIIITWQLEEWCTEIGVAFPKDMIVTQEEYDKAVADKKIKANND